MTPCPMAGVDLEHGANVAALVKSSCACAILFRAVRPSALVSWGGNRYVIGCGGGVGGIPPLDNR